MAGVKEMGLTCCRLVIFSPNPARVSLRLSLSPLNQEHGKSPRAGDRVPTGTGVGTGLCTRICGQVWRLQSEIPVGRCPWRVLAQGAAPGHPPLPSHVVAW